jgi:multidrug resistance efflux pump
MASDERDNVVERTPREYIEHTHGWREGSESERASMAEAVSAWEADRAELAQLRAQVAERDADLAALVEMAKVGVERVETMHANLGIDESVDDVLLAARAALARVEARLVEQGSPITEDAG